MAKRRRYTVKSGDTFSSIAKRYGLESSLVAKANADIGKLRPGISVDVPVVSTGYQGMFARVPTATGGTPYYKGGEYSYSPPVFGGGQPPPIPPVEQPALYHPNVLEYAAPAGTYTAPPGLYNTVLSAPDNAPKFVSSRDMLSLKNQFNSVASWAAMVAELLFNELFSKNSRAFYLK